MTRNSLLALALLVGCGSSASTTAPATTPPVAAAPSDDPTCPVLVAGTSVSVEDTDSGAALVFVTTGDAAAVRTRARALADMHNAHHAKMEQPAGAADPHAGHGAHAGHGGHAGHGAADGSASATKPASGGPMGTMIAAHSKAEVTEIENGARVAFVAHDPGAIQSELRAHASHLGTGSCEM